MGYDTKDNLQHLWQEETKVRQQAQRFGALANLGFVGLVATEAFEFFASEKMKKSGWRLGSFIVSATAVIGGVIGNWIMGNRAEKMREENLMVEHSASASADTEDAMKWRAAVEAQKQMAQGISK